MGTPFESVQSYPQIGQPWLFIGLHCFIFTQTQLKMSDGHFLMMYLGAVETPECDKHENYFLS